MEQMAPKIKGMAMKVLHFGSSNVREFAENLIDMCKDEDEVRGVFLGITVTADKNSTIKSIVARCRDERRFNFTARHFTSANLRRAQKLGEKRTAAQLKLNTHVRQLKTLNFLDDVTVLDWLCQYQKLSNHLVSDKGQYHVLNVFAANGYRSDVEREDSRHKEGLNRGNIARHIIQQALHCIDDDGIGTVDKVIHTVVESWKRKFIPVKT